MKKASTIFLQCVIVLAAIGSLALLLLEPLREGVNAHHTYFQIYLQDPFIAYAYLSSIAYFTALYQAFRLLGAVRRGEEFSMRSVKALRTIKICAIVIVCAVLGAEIWIGFTHGNDDAAGGVMMGLILMLIAAVAGTAAAVFERTLQRAVEMKSENDLTV